MNTDIAILEEGFQKFLQTGSLLFTEKIDPLDPDKYEEYKKRAEVYRDLYHYIVIFNDQKLQEEKTKDIIDYLREFREAQTRTKYKELFNKLLYDLVHGLAPEERFHSKKLAGMNVTERLDYMLEVYKMSSEFRPDSFSIPHPYTHLFFKNYHSLEYYSWSLKFYAQKSFEEKISHINFKNFQSLFELREEIKEHIALADTINHADLEEIKFIKPEIATKAELYFMVSNFHLVIEYQPSVFSTCSPLVNAYRDIDYLLPFLNSKIEELKGSTDLVPVDGYLKEIYNGFDGTEKKWLVAGVLLATGKIKPEVVKFNNNVQAFCKALFGKNQSSFRPYMSQSYYDTTSSDKNIYSRPKKMKKVIEYMQNNNIEISSDFLAKYGISKEN